MPRIPENWIKRRNENGCRRYCPAAANVKSGKLIGETVPMSNPISTMVNALVQLENSVGRLYAQFALSFPEDHAFWELLAAEEANHACILEALTEFDANAGELSRFFPEPVKDSILAVNKKLEGLLRNISHTRISREEALNIGIQIEESAGETHFQNMSIADTPSRIVATFQLLVSADKDHAERLKNYLRQIENK